MTNDIYRFILCSYANGFHLCIPIATNYIYIYIYYKRIWHTLKINNF